MISTIKEKRQAKSAPLDNCMHACHAAMGSRSNVHPITPQKSLLHFLCATSHWSGRTFRAQSHSQCRRRSHTGHCIAIVHGHPGVFFGPLFFLRSGGCWPSIPKWSSQPSVLPCARIDRAEQLQDRVPRAGRGRPPNGIDVGQPVQGFCSGCSARQAAAGRRRRGI